MSRDAALARYEELPVPDTTQEAWRFTNLRGFDPNAYTAEPDASMFQTESILPELEVAGWAEVSETGLRVHSVPAIEGVRFEPLDENHPRLHSIVGWDEKFAAHNAALWKHGLLVHVPKGVVIDEPLYVRIANSVPDGSIFWRLLVVAEEGSRFSLIEEYASAAPDLKAYTNAVAELFVEQEAKFEYVSLQNLSRETWHFATHHARVEKDGELDWVAGGFGSRSGKTRIQNDLNGPGATSRVTGAYFADGTQHLDYDTFQEHIAPSTESDFAFKGALRESAHSVWRGMIRVEPDAQKTNAYQENRNLLLSPEAHADSIPGLEIMANDVRCTHGATLGRVNREELFYLMARGLSRGEAERLIVRGFFQDVLDRIDLEPVREALGSALEARIPQA
jgi:Fe-S cluster assembly protein SufD